MTKLYVYELNSLEHMATIICENEEECETNAMSLFGADMGYAWTFIPRFGKADGLKYDQDAAVLDYRIGK